MTPYSQKKKMQPLESLSFLASLPNTEIGQKSPSCNNVYIMCMHQGKSGAVCWQKRGLWLEQRRCPPCTWSWQLWNLAWKKGNFWEASLISHPFVSPLPKSPPDIQQICRVHTQSSSVFPLRSPCVYNRRLNLDQNLLVVHLLYCVSFLYQPHQYRGSKWFPSSSLSFRCSD